MRVQTSSNVDILQNSNGHISVIVMLQSHGYSRCYSYTYCVCWCDRDPIQGQRQGHGPFELPRIDHNCTFLRLSPPLLSRGAQNWWLVVIAWDLIYRLSEPDFIISFYESYHESSNFAECRYFTKFKWPYFGTAWCYCHMVGHAGSPTRTVYVDMTLTRSKVNVKVTGLLDFRQLPKPCMLAAMTAAPLPGFLVIL